MKAVILAGGFGTRLSEETVIKPKPMVEIGGKPILWHILKIFGHYGINDFVICLGYKGYVIKEYFANYFLHNSNLTIDLTNNTIENHDTRSEPWRVTLVDTGSETNTGGRIARVKEFIGDQTFLMTYGDGVSDVNISQLLETHYKSGKLATVTAAHRPGRFGVLEIGQSGAVERFAEKPIGEGGWINAGFFVLDPGIFKYIDGDAAIWEQEPMTRLARDGQLAAHRHEGFWYPMDVLRDKAHLEELWNSGAAPWRKWDV